MSTLAPQDNTPNAVIPGIIMIIIVILAGIGMGCGPVEPEPTAEEMIQRAWERARVQAVTDTTDTANVH